MIPMTGMTVVPALAVVLTGLVRLGVRGHVRLRGGRVIVAHTHNLFPIPGTGIFCVSRRAAPTGRTQEGAEVSAAGLRGDVAFGVGVE